MSNSSGKEGSTIRNILLLVGDQHRSDCIGAYGNRVVQTPNIDALAAGGVRFTHAFTPMAICTPARACIQTGLEPRNHGLIFNWEFWRWRGGEWNLPPEQRMFSQDLVEAGYRCAHVGKWHIGDHNTPADYGYEGVYYPGYGYPDVHPHYLEYLRGLGLSGFNLSRHNHSPSVGHQLYYALQEGPQEASIPGYLARQSIDFINQFADEGKPFFVSCNFWGPHAPFRITNPHLDMYDPADIDPWPNFGASLDDKPRIIRRQGESFGTEHFDDNVLRDMIARHYGYVTLIDDEIGRILDTLRQRGILDETLVLYVSDHGEGLGSYRMWDKGFGMYDCLWRVPLIVHHPSIAPAVVDDFVNLTDLAPTLLEAAGTAPAQAMDGRSLMPILRDGSQAGADDYILREHFGHQFPVWQRMVRTRTAKYIYNPSDRDEFYDLANDPWEMQNIIDTVDRPLLKQMKDRVHEQIKATRDPIGGWAQRTLYKD